MVRYSDIVKKRTMKICPSCNNGKGRLLPVSHFGNDASRPDGKDGYCKKCRQEIINRAGRERRARAKKEKELASTDLG